MPICSCGHRDKILYGPWLGPVLHSASALEGTHKDMSYSNSDSLWKKNLFITSPCSYIAS